MSRDDTKRKSLGRYELLEEIGRGGMAVVYRAFDTSLKREVAVKLLHAHLGSHKEARDRFEREAHSVAKLHHNSIVEVYDYSETENDEVFIVMELVEGTTLRKFLEQRHGKPLVAEASALIAREIFLALEAAHQEGIVHRDVKPENILIGEDGTVRLSDFGIAYLAGIGQMTVTGQILGSPTYMSPEHIERAIVDARADIFSVGTLLYEMAVGNLPFFGNNPHQIIKRVVEGYYDHPLSVNPAVGHGVASVIVKCLQQQPERRYESAKEAAVDLDTILSQMSVSSTSRELKEFFQDPDKWEAEVRDRIVSQTLNLGKKARKAGRMPEAMNHFNRVLAIEPQNVNALDAVNVLSRRRQLRRGLERFGVFMLIVLAILGILWFVIKDNLSLETGDEETVALMSTDEGTDTSAPLSWMDTNISDEGFESVHGTDSGDSSRGNGIDTAASLGKIVIIEKDGTDAQTNSLKDSDLSKDTEGRDILVSPARKYRPLKKQNGKEQKRTVLFNPHPMSVDVILDDTERFVYKTTDRSRELAVGKHSVTFYPNDKRLLPMTKTFLVKEGEGSMTVGARLKWKPGRLLVRSNVRAMVSVEGRTNGKTNTGFEIPIQNGPQEGIKIIISAKGYRPTTRQVTINAGKTAELVVHLEKEQL